MKEWFFNLFKKSKNEVVACTEHVEQKAAPEPEIKVHVEQPLPALEIKVNVTTKKRHEHEEHEPASRLSCLDFDKPVGELGRFLNYRMYKVDGTNKSGKKSFKLRTGVDSQQAIEKVAALDLLPPFEAEPLDYEPATERQLNYLKDLGVFVPDDITKDDASCMISRAVGEDSKESPAPYLVALANGLKTEFSAFIGADGLLKSIIGQANDRDRAALYAYAVCQSVRGGSFRNMLEDTELSVFYAFADKTVEDPSLMRSLSGRTAEDFVHPNRNTSIYRATKAFLASEISTK